eukprot:scaffold5466_cov108-Isochrysis_galbana.AAC.8
MTSVVSETRAEERSDDETRRDAGTKDEIRDADAVDDGFLSVGTQGRREAAQTAVGREPLIDRARGAVTNQLPEHRRELDETH